MVTILDLPIEIVSMIASLLRIDHVFNFGSTCQHFRYILHNDSICRVALKQARFSPENVEAQSTRAYAKAFRQLAKRQKAVRSGEPFLVAMIAWAEDFIYTNGVLCYSASVDTIRVLDIHRSATTELVLGASSCLPETIPDFSWTRPYRFAPVHYCDGILSCSLIQQTNGISAHWLAILDVKKAQLVGLQEIPDPRKLFVRNNSKYLLFGTKSRLTNAGQRRWEVTSYDLQRQQIAQPTLTLWDFDGEDIGLDICFEIFDDYFYCVSNKASVYRRFPRNSYYHAFRFPLEYPEKKRFEYPQDLNLWRRYILEGSTDPRWNSMQLVKDEASGEITIYECRKESRHDCAQSQRTCYKRELHFDNDTVERSTAVSRNTPDAHDNSDNTNDAGRDESEIDLETYTEERPPESFHVGEDGACDVTFAINECFVRSYIPSCETFLDIVSTPPFPMPETQQLRLRTRPKDYDDEISSPSKVPNDQSQFSEAANEAETSKAAGLGMHHDTEYWPCEHSATRPNPSCNILRDILAVLSLVTELEWAMDDRSLIYAAVGKGQLRPIVLVSFDSGIHLPGFKNSISHDLDIGRPKTWPFKKYPSTERRHQNHDGPQFADPGANMTSDMDPNMQSVDKTPCTPLSESQCSRTKATSTVVGLDIPSWAKPVEAFYMKVPKVFAGHPYGADLTR